MTKPLKYFGTDGIRGEYGGEIINEQFAFSLGVAFARFLEEKNVISRNLSYLPKTPGLQDKNYSLAASEGWSRKTFKL